MKLSNVEMILGTVLDDYDPKKLGRVKVGAPGVFDRMTQSIKAIPWVYPLTMGHMQSYSHLQTGAKVWLIINKENQEEYWYIPYHELNNDTKEAINDDIESDVIFSRNICGEVTQIYSNKEEGLTLRNGESYVTLNNDGQIVGKVGGEDGSSACFKIAGGNFYCGNDSGEWFKMVKGESLYDILKNMAAHFSNLAICAQGNNTSTLVPDFKALSEETTQLMNELLSERSFVSA